MLKIAHGDLELVETARGEAVLDLDELCRLAARDVIAVALKSQRRTYLKAHAAVVGDDARRLVVGHGYARRRQRTMGAGAADVRSPRVRGRRESERFSSTLLPAYMRRSPKVTGVLPILLGCGPALAELLARTRRGRVWRAGPPSTGAGGSTRKS